MVTLPQRIHLDAANILMIPKIGSKITKCQMHNYRNQRRDSKYSHSTWVFQQNSRFIQCCPNFLTAIMMMYVRTGPPFLGRRQCDYDKNLFLIKKNSRKDLHFLFYIPNIDILLSFFTSSRKCDAKMHRGRGWRPT